MASTRSQLRRLTLQHIAVALGLVCLIYGASKLAPPVMPESAAETARAYWIWAGVSATQAPYDATLYIYQGVWDSKQFTRHGLYPHPCSQREVYLVYRITGPYPEPETLLNQFAKDMAGWDRHGIQVKGIQIDCDCPTSKLRGYGEYLSNVRQLLPKKYHLSITALCSWIEPAYHKDITSLVGAVDELVLQTYQHRSYVQFLEKYVDYLGLLNINFKLGLLLTPLPRRQMQRLRHHPGYRGEIIFIQNGS